MDIFISTNFTFYPRSSLAYDSSHWARSERKAVSYLAAWWVKPTQKRGKKKSTSNIYFPHVPAVTGWSKGFFIYRRGRQTFLPKYWLIQKLEATGPARVWGDSSARTPLMLFWLLQWPCPSFRLRRTSVPGKLLRSDAGQSQPIHTPRFMLRIISVCRNAHKVEFEPHVKVFSCAVWYHPKLWDESSIVCSTTETFKSQPAPAPKYINLNCTDMLK